MRLLLVTQYYPPEVGAPQNRLHELLTRLQKKGVDVTVLTAMPNYPSYRIFDRYKGKIVAHEYIDSISVYRTWIFVSNSKSVLHRLLNYFSFVVTSLFRGLFLKGKYDIIMCESPPLFLGVSAWLLSKIKRCKLVFNVSDLWPESAEKLEIVTNKTLIQRAYNLEAFLYKKSRLVSGQTQGIVNNIKERFPGKEVYWLKNGVDVNLYTPEAYSKEWRYKNGFNDDDILFLYAGILGHAQGLEVIIRAAERTTLYKHVKYLIVGAGPEEQKLKALVKESNLNNVIFFDIQPKSVMPFIVSSVDSAIIPLKKLDLFKGAIPSKIFENLAMKKPIILGVDGEARELFITQADAGWFFEPENDLALSEVVKQVAEDTNQVKVKGENARRYVEKEFNRDIIANDFYMTLKSIC